MRSPLFVIQQRAFDQTLDPVLRADAIGELGVRYAENARGEVGEYSPAYQKRLVKAYVDGWNEVKERRSGHQRHGNWNRPLENAWQQGRRDHINLRDLVSQS